MKTKVNGFGGAIAVNRNGDVAMEFNTKRMPWVAIGCKASGAKKDNGSQEDLDLLFEIDPRISMKEKL